MALMDNILNSTDVLHLDKLLQNFEFENKQCVKLIEKENQQIDAIKKANEERKSEIINLRRLINELDDNTKRSHKQFTQNRDNCESLRKTTVVLMEHEFALNKKLNSIVSTSEHDRGEREGVLQHYKNIWDEYESVYKSFPLAIQLHEERTEFSQLSLQVDEAKKQAANLQKKITQVLGREDINFKNLNSFIIKIAEVKLETTRILHQIQTSIKDRDELGKVVQTYPGNRNVEERQELMEIDGVKESESQSTMIGMYCNMTDENNEEEDIIALNTNNNKEMHSGIPQAMETVNKQRDCVSEEQQKAMKMGVENQNVLPLCSVPPNIQITKPQLIHQKMPSQMRVNDANNGNQFESQRKPTHNQKQSVPPLKVCNQPRLLTPFTSQHGSSKTKAPELTQRPPLIIPHQFHPSPVIRKIAQSPSIPRLIQSVNQTSTFSNETNQKLHKNFNFMPVLPVVSGSNTEKDRTLTQLSVVDKGRTQILNNQFSPNKILNSDNQVNVPQSPLTHHQTQTVSSKTPKTPESSESYTSKTSESPFDINKHKEHLKQMWKSPNAKPLKGRSMFSEEIKEDDSGLSSQFIQPFIQSDARKSSPKFNISAFSNVSSPDTPSEKAFNFENIGVSPTQETNYMSIFQDDTPQTTDATNAASSFSFSFDGSDSRTSEPSGFTFNFGSPETEESTMFNLF